MPLQTMFAAGFLITPAIVQKVNATKLSVLIHFSQSKIACRVSKCAPPQDALEQQVKSSLLRSLLHYPDMSQDVDYFLDAMSTKAAQEGKKRKLFFESDQYPEVTKYRAV